MSAVDVDELEAKVKDMYRQVALDPHGDFHFELGRQLAERLGYDPALLDLVPAGAVDSFAGVGFTFGLARLAVGERVLDLGSGSGMDVFYAAHLVGGTGRATGIDFTPEQLDKARRLGAEGGFAQVDFVEGAIDDTPFGDGFFDCVISNGVINLAPDKAQVFTEAARVLRPGGRIAVADIVTERQLTEAIVCDTDLWASCIGGAAQQDAYRDAIEAAGLTIDEVRDNTYSFISRQAVRASAKYGVRSVSVLAHKAH